NWTVASVVEMDTWDHPDGPSRLVDLLPPDHTEHLWGAAVDIGTTTVSLYLVDLLTGEVATKAAEYNGQIKRGEDVISRIIYASKNNGLGELQTLVVGTINELLERAARRAKISPSEIYKMTVAGNSTMIHLFLGLPPNSIRLEPFVTTINHPSPVRASELGLNIHPQANVDCLPGVASYVGADISSGVIGSQMCDSSDLTLFLDVGTNGEMVLGDCDWLISCACSAGPAFEGAGVQDGMRATIGAIEEVWINSETYEPTYRVIPNPRLEAQGQPTPPHGICGSGLISLLSEMFITGVIDKAGNLNFDLGSPRIRPGEHGPEYVVAWGNETEQGRDISITKVDIDNLIRAKGAIYAGFTVLAQSIGIDLAMVERVLIGGSFGQYINIEKAIQIGLLPDLPWEKFHFLGNTSLRGALLALLDREYRQRITEAAQKMTYLELSADNTFYEAFTSALFLPHTDLSQFPSVAEVLGARDVQPTR
ncbi:MAG: ASKHA domain-containing protein, partial [Anaerolineae bacterium]